MPNSSRMLFCTGVPAQRDPWGVQPGERVRAERKRGSARGWRRHCLCAPAAWSPSHPNPPTPLLCPPPPRPLGSALTRQQQQPLHAHLRHHLARGAACALHAVGLIDDDSLPRHRLGRGGKGGGGGGRRGVGWEGRAEGGGEGRGSKAGTHREEGAVLEHHLIRRKHDVGLERRAAAAPCAAGEWRGGGGRARAWERGHAGSGCAQHLVPLLLPMPLLRACRRHPPVAPPNAERT